MRISKFLFINFFLLISISLIGQEECKVLIPELSGDYKGKCKKGYAHGKGLAWGVDTFFGKFSKGYPDGKGIYTWANGDKYSGYFEKGKMHGEGVLTFTFNNVDSVMTGIWEKGKYKGPKPKAPKVTYSRGVTRQTFTRINDQFNKIEIKIMKGGTENPDVTSYSFSSTSGIQNGRYLEEVVYPVEITIRYQTTSALTRQRGQVEFEFTIFEPGNWLVVINN